MTDYGIRHVARGAPLHEGAVVYRVIEFDPPLEPSTWKVVARIVDRASPKQIKRQTPFPGLGRTIFDPKALGSLFFETPLQAIHGFLTECRREIEEADRKKTEAEKAIVWATSQEGLSP